MLSDKAGEEEIAYLGAVELGHLFRTGALSPVEATKAALARIEAHDEAVGAFAFVDPEGALAAARASEARWKKGEACGPLDGVPTTIKDIVWVKGWHVTYGSRVKALTITADSDSPHVARLREAGAVLLGLTNTPELGWKALTDSACHGITRNPWDLRKTPGGSSGGAAAAAALGMGALHVGSDGGGSIRIPAGFTGLVGHKPSFGRVPAWPTSAFGTVSHNGPIARTVADAAAMLTVLSGWDARDWYALPVEGRDYGHDLGAGVMGLKVAFAPTLGGYPVDPEIAEAVKRAALAFEALGARVETADPGFDLPLEIFHKHWFAGAAYRLKDLSAEEKAELDPGLQEIAAEGATYSLMDYMDAVQARARLGTRMRQFHERYDLLLTPTLALPAFDAGREVPEGSGLKRWTEWAAFSYPFNLTQQPACSVPCGLTSAGLPIGLQIVGPMHADALVLRAAQAFEQTRRFTLPRAPRPKGESAEVEAGMAS